MRCLRCSPLCPTLLHYCLIPSPTGTDRFKAHLHKLRSPSPGPWHKPKTKMGDRKRQRLTNVMSLLRWANHLKPTFCLLCVHGCVRVLTTNCRISQTQDAIFVSSHRSWDKKVLKKTAPLCLQKETHERKQTDFNWRLCFSFPVTKKLNIQSIFKAV